eukprot:10430265-Alexandrium_andersonii.AAC.1
MHVGRDAFWVAPNGPHHIGPTASCSPKLQKVAFCSFLQLWAVLCSLVRFGALSAGGCERLKAHEAVPNNCPKLRKAACCSFLQ